MEHTELENKMLEYIKYLLTTSNIMAVALENIYRSFEGIHDWAGENMKTLSSEQNYTAMVEHLNKEFGTDFKVTDVRDISDD